MKIKGIDGKIYTLKFRTGNIGNKKSGPHLRARNLLTKKFPSYRIIEEVFVPRSKSKLYLDFFIPRLMLAIEVQGKQHTKFSQHFHGHKFFFEQQKNRDNSKIYVCVLNGIKLLEFFDFESIL